MSLAEVLVGLAWQRDALCAEPEHAGIDFFAEGRGVDYRPAKAVCARCLVREECAEFAIEHGLVYGVWGGLSPQERRKRGR